MRIFWLWGMIVTAVFGLTGNALAERVSVNVNMGNVRSGPGDGYDILWKVEKNHPLEVMKKSGEWYYFKDFEDDKGWIHKSIVSAKPSVISHKDQCKVRSGPGTQHDVVFTVEKGVPFEVVERKKEWIHIRHADGDEGWIHESLVW